MSGQPTRDRRVFCAKCGREVVAFYRIDPETGRMTSEVSCDSCYETAAARASRERMDGSGILHERGRRVTRAEKFES